jgi:hypothetical protein
MAKLLRVYEVHRLVASGSYAIWNTQTERWVTMRETQPRYWLTANKHNIMRANDIWTTTGHSTALTIARRLNLRHIQALELARRKATQRALREARRRNDRKE